MNLHYSGDAAFKVKANGAKNIRVIEIIPRQIVTNSLSLAPKIVNNEIVSDTSRDILKLVVVERHNATGNVGVGFVQGVSASARRAWFHRGARRT